MDHIQASDSNTRTATQGQSFKLMDLPIEVRLMVYRYIMYQGGFHGSLPPLLSVCQQIREEALPIFYRSSIFPLYLHPQPHTETTALAFARVTRLWFNMIGVDNINNLRYVAFRFAPTESDDLAACMYIVGLWCRDAGDWDYRVKGVEPKYGSLESDLEWSKNHVPQHTTEDAEYARCRAEHIKRCKAALQQAQKAMDQFVDACADGKRIRPTVDSLGILAGALVAVEKARLIDARD
jgi:hypothetical protein